MPVGSPRAEALRPPPLVLGVPPTTMADRCPRKALASRLERTVDLLVLPLRWTRCGFRRVSVGRSLRSSPGSPTAPCRCGNGDFGPWPPHRQGVFARSTGLSTNLFRCPQNAGTCPHETHRRPALFGPAPWLPVRSRGLEPPRDYSHSDLNAARLPVPPRPLVEFGSVPAAPRQGEPAGGAQSPSVTHTRDQSTVPSTAAARPCRRSAATAWVRNWAMGTTTASASTWASASAH